jgi:hypothetical protein
MTIDVVLRAIVIGEQVEAKALELVMDQYKPRAERRTLITNNDYAWLDGLEIDREYKLTLEPK